VAEGPDVRVLGEGKWLRLVSDRGWEHVERVNSHGVVVILAITDEGRIVLVEQHRHAVGARVIEPPAGLRGDGDHGDESGEVAARRELLEETGYEAAGMEFLLECPSSPGMVSETYSVYRATGLRRVGPGGGDDSEDITVHQVPLDGIADFLLERRARGVQADTKLLAVLWLAGAPAPA
jgi:ADP-ribose pyrophosphatase